MSNRKATIPIIDSVAEYVRIICQISRTHREECKLLRDTDIVLYRGHSSLKHELIPSIARPIHESISKESYLPYEGDLIQEGLDRLSGIINKEMPSIEILGVLQHFGVPTRLLDMTENALVALYFACELSKGSNNEGNGEVFCMAHTTGGGAQHYIVDAIAHTYRFVHNTKISLKDYLEIVRKQKYYVEDQSVYSEPSDDDLLGSIMQERMYSVPKRATSPYSLLRQRAQQGCYLVFPNQVKNGFILPDIKPIEKDDERICARIQIKGEAKKTILRDLRSMGISKETMFPESGDRVAEGIKERYKDFLAEKKELQEADYKKGLEINKRLRNKSSVQKTTMETVFK